MRHKKQKTRFSRMQAHRKATLSMIAKHLFIHHSIKTTLVKAREARRLAEYLITVAKKNDLASKRRVFSILRDRTVTKKLFNDITPLFNNRIGGYTRIIPLQFRRGDGANIVILELTEKIKEKEPLKKEKIKYKKAKIEEKKERVKPETPKAGPGVEPEVKEQRVVEEAKKEKARKEDKKIEKKSFFKRFFRRRTKM